MAILLNATWTVFIRRFPCLSVYSKRFYNTSQHSPSHTHIHTLRAGEFSTKSQPVHQELTHTHTHTHTPMAQLSGAIWDSVSYPRTLQHVDQRARDRTTDVLIGRRPALPTDPQLKNLSQ